MRGRQRAKTVKEYALDLCARTHPDVYDSLICVGPGSEKGLGPPCSDCMRMTQEHFRRCYTKNRRLNFTRAKRRAANRF